MFRTSHPLWLAGFRPFFLLAALAGLILPPLWAMIFTGWTASTASPLDPLRWHAHEMYYGFGWAVLGGFLLTASKNWVGIRGYHGGVLIALSLAWLLERLALSAGAGWPPVWLAIAAFAFLGSIAMLLGWTLLRYRRQDSYRDNLLFVVALPAFLFAKYQLLYGDFAGGAAMTLALFRLAFLVMLERTLTQFMKAACQTDILRTPWLDLPIKLLGLALAGVFWLPATWTAGLSLLLAGLLLIRLPFWRPDRACRRLDVGIMFVGYLAIVGQLLLEAWATLAGPAWIGALPTHVFTFGAMGCVIPAMIVRIANGHTGRKVVFSAVDRSVLWLMLGALLIRVGLTQLAPAHYAWWIGLAALCWLAAFGLLLLRYAPVLMQPRIDGREH